MSNAHSRCVAGMRLTLGMRARETLAMDHTELEGKVALVTGAGSGIGRASALLLARAGARVGLLGRTEDELREVEGAIVKGNGRADVLVADVAREDQVEAAV